MRHLIAWSNGEDNDKESGLSHLGHAACNIMFLLHMKKYRPDMDDRGKNDRIDDKESKELYEGTILAYINSVLAQNITNEKKAELLGVSIRTVYRMLKRNRNNESK